MFHRRQRDMRVWNSMRASKWLEKFHFGWATPLRTQTEDLEKHKALSCVIKMKEDICCERDPRKHYKSSSSDSVFSGTRSSHICEFGVSLALDLLIPDSESVLFSWRRSTSPSLESPGNACSEFWTELQSVLKTIHSL